MQKSRSNKIKERRLGIIYKPKHIKPENEKGFLTARTRERRNNKKWSCWYSIRYFFLVTKFRNLSNHWKQGNFRKLIIDLLENDWNQKQAICIGRYTYLYSDSFARQYTVRNFLFRHVYNEKNIYLCSGVWKGVRNFSNIHLKFLFCCCRLYPSHGEL